jgi:hypothetical protein
MGIIFLSPAHTVLDWLILFSLFSLSSRILMIVSSGYLSCTGHETRIPMAKWRRSLNTKLVASFALMMIIVSSLSFFYTYGEARNQLNQSARDKLMDITGAMSTQISGDALMSLSPGDENTSTYLAIIGQMRDMRSDSADIVNIYAMKLAGDNVSFIVDDADEGAAHIGQEYSHPKLVQIKEAPTIPSASATFYSDEFGTYMSGYAPIKDSNGTTLAILGVDVTAVATLQQIDNERNSTAIIIVLSSSSEL